MNKEEFTRHYLELGLFGNVLQVAGVEDGGNNLDELYEWAKEIDKVDEKKPRSFTGIAWEMYDWLVNYVEENHPDSDPSVKLHMNNLLHFFAITFLYQIVEES